MITMTYQTKLRCALIGGVMAALGANVAAADTVTLLPSKDNTLIQSSTGALSNGAGDGIFSGRTASTAGGIRLRAVLAFDLSSIPPGSTIESASLTLTIYIGVGGNQTHTLHRLLADWGEGTSNGGGGQGDASTPGDATWIHRFYPNVLWGVSGGSFNAASSASQIVGNDGSFTWTSLTMRNDVQNWLNNPGTNFGWLVRGNENILMTAKKFYSKDSFDDLTKPKLVVVYTPPPPPPCDGDVDESGAVNVDDLLAVINAWGPCPAKQPCPADVEPAETGNGEVNVDDLLMVINNWGDCP